MLALTLRRELRVGLAGYETGATVSGIAGEDEDDFPEQFSQQTREALTNAVEELVTVLRAHAEHVGRLRGGSSEIPGIFEVNARVEQSLAAWNERAFDHTGTFPVSLAGLGDESGASGDDGVDDDDFADGTPLAVVSRWDLVVSDAEALVASGRQAHLRNRPDEQEEDAAVAVSGVGQALYAVLHERGEPWYDLPGVEVVRGVRAYVQPEQSAQPFTDDVAETEALVEEPPGERLYLESWA